MSFKIRDRSVGDGSPCYITFEAGPTHSGLESAKELVRLAGEAGADAVKFQIFNPERLIADKAQLFSYEVLVNRETGELKTVSEPLYDILKRRSMTAAEWKEVKAVADEVGLAFFSTIGFPEDIELLVEMGCDSVKIASADVNHFPLIKLAAESGMCVQLDTGSSSLADIERAVDVIVATGNEKIIIHQCPSGYPARVESIHLRMIQTMKAMFPFPIAFSDHTPGWDMDVAALALGANLLEKTITMDRTTPSVEHVFSLEGADMQRFIHTTRDVEIAMGQARRVLSTEEITRRNKIRRSLFAKRDLKAGQTISLDDIDFRRPGTGIQPDSLHLVEGRILGEDVAEGQMLSLENFLH
jgi:sialic acid synthase SpsE